MNQYETLIVLKAELSEEQTREELDKVSALIAKYQDGEAEKATYEQQKPCGVRKLDVAKGKRVSGKFFLLHYTANGQVVSELNRQLLINENSVRHMTVRRDKFSPDAELSFGDEPDPRAKPRSSRPSRDEDNHDEFLERKNEPSSEGDEVQASA